MDLLYIAFPAALLLGAFFLGLFLWASRRGQYDDLDTPSIRMLHDDDPAAPDERAQPPAAGPGEAGKE